jgi:hypothetical protein
MNSYVAILLPTARSTIARTFGPFTGKGARANAKRFMDVNIALADHDASLWLLGTLQDHGALSCDRCGCDMELAADTSGVCTDAACPYSDHPQWIDYDYLTEHTSQEVYAEIERVEGTRAADAYTAIAKANSGAWY